jgi:hypothetical protein
LVCSNWSTLPTLTWSMQLASMWSISCNIQHLPQQRDQHKMQWSMHWKRTFHHFQQANMATQRSHSHNDINMQLRARLCWRWTGSKYLDHFAASNLKWSFWWRNDRKHTF